MSMRLGPNAAKVLPRLKDFQRTSVEYAFRRMYLDENPTTRFLVADEVGLGKTMVARGIIARVIDELESKVERIDVIYVCSNSAIARQNVNKLAMQDNGDVVLSSRITMLPLDAHRLRDNRVNLVSFTPATSFDLRSNLGVSKERILLYYLLERAWGIKGASARSLLRGKVSRERFRDKVASFADDDIDEQLATDFITALKAQPKLKAEFLALADEFHGVSNRQSLEKILRDRQRALIGQLRDVLAKACLRSLQPDLIILDEFQRFKHLLSADDDESILARELFDYTDHDNNRARVLLLSATPYKMYTESDEGGGEDHYQDFLATIRFLQQDAARTSHTEALLGDYRREWLRMDPGFEGRIQSIKHELESELKRVMIRTERLAVTPDRDGMLTTVPCCGMTIGVKEALAYRQLGRIAEMVEHSDPMEYWKSAPYLLSFMEDYRFKQDFQKALEPESTKKVASFIDRRLPLLLPWQEIEGYRRLDPANARMNWLVDRAVDSGAWKLLWMPPIRPWYQLGGPFAETFAAEFTKLLVFSGWKVVPKAIAAVVSYEAERRMMEAGGNQENTQEARRRFSPPLRAEQESLFALTYPSFSLARLAAQVSVEPETRTLTPEQVLERTTARVEEMLAGLPPGVEGGQVDLSWHWAAPALLDWKEDPWAAEAWFKQTDLAEEWTGSEERGEDAGVEQMRIQVLYGAARSGGKILGPRPPDLARMLASIALAGPATAALAALAGVLGGESRLRSFPVRNAAGRIGWAFRGYYNLPEIVHLLRGIGPEVPYWQVALKYGLEGGIGAVLGEYVHVLNDWLGLNDHELEEAATQMADTVVEALGIRTASLSADDLRPGPKGTLVREQKRLRSRYAARLADERGEDDKEANRIDHVRTAFNSPFWPFVLATTSIGQEGLDFHLYCHAVVHWNLPSNPVDLEQREGRVHRYKGHAVRKNVALKHGAEPNGGGLGDPWTSMFGAAEACRPAGNTEIWPFWVYSVEGGAQIERHVPAMPLSRDVARMERVRRMSGLYRMVFGQVRQEDLLSCIARVDTADGARSLLIDLHP